MMIEDVKQRCFKFLERALKELEGRIPTNFEIFKNISSLRPEKMLNPGQRIEFQNLPFQEFMTDKLTIEQQYRAIQFINWKEDELFTSTGLPVPTDPVTFFGILRDHLGADGEPDFRELSDYILDCHCLPMSNCYVERMFSMMGFIKSKWKNRTSLEMLDALLMIKCKFASSSTCCKSMTVSREMMKLHNSTMYDFLCREKKRKAEQSEKEQEEENRNQTLDDEEFDFFVVNIPVNVN